MGKDIVGYTKMIDQKGRVLIPREGLRACNLNPEDLVEVWVKQTEDGCMVLELVPHQIRCTLCNESLYAGKFKHFKKKAICSECIEQLKDPQGRVTDGE